MTWEAIALVVSSPEDEQRVDELLADGWEPYAATTFGSFGESVRMHLRRAIKDHSAVTQPEPDPMHFGRHSDEAAR